MKFTGAILLWTAFTLIGMKISLSLKKRVSVLDETILLLASLITEIQFSKSDIVKILYDFSSEASLKNLNFLDVFSKLSPYGDFHSVWHEAVSLFPYYKIEEKEKMLQLGSFLGTTDTSSQIKTIKLYISFFETYRANAYKDYEKYGKASSLFGLFIGASAFILLI